MKKRFFSLGCLLFATGLFVSLAAGATANAKPMEAKADGESKTYYLVGSFAENYSNYADAGNWNNANNKYPVYEGAEEAAIFHFKKEGPNDEKCDEFKFFVSGSWDDGYSYYNLNGSAKNAFRTYGSGGNILCKRDGDYAVYINNSKLYIDYADDTEFAYTGSDPAKSDDGESTWHAGWSQNKVKVGGDPVSYSFKSNEQFKFKLPDTWTDELNYLSLKSTDGNNYYYKAFQRNDGQSEDKNIKCLYQSTYNVAITHNTNHELVLSITNSDTSTLYVLDLNGDCLNYTHKGHYYNDTYGLETGWPGSDMEKVDGTKNIYKIQIWNVMTHVIFNNIPYKDGPGRENNPQAVSANNNKCLIFTYETTEVPSDNGTKTIWNNNTWLSLDAANFIDTYMKFETHHQETKEEGTGDGYCKTQGWYDDARGAFNDDLNDTQRAEVLSVGVVADRLEMWAAANTDKVSSSGITNARFISLQVEQANSMSAIIIISAIVLVGGITVALVLRKRKED